ncbi:5'-3' exoribonuclease 3-like [Quercus robur]|uniref:5'-3' exoribonuclease 3-like n=1 Tax=Quercus robur TaxID=38942 RepID=UPI002163E970|nr:5'-3' exoribonuclease 3-like [Quercus robur]
MGVPSFYRWLINKYPNVVVKAIEERQEQDSEKIDTTLPNPNGIEFDNLYLDMNGIIHPCFHPDDHPSPPETFEEVFNNIFEYIDRLFSIVRPRKLLYMAIDGVAPRAKMNQQRCRRFRTAKDNEIAAAEEEKLRRQFEREGKPVLPKRESEVSDSNIITPGTEFMYKLSKALGSYISSRINNDPGWRNIKVILSDSNVPGEGEHKVMSFIRYQRNVSGYDPNTRHCLYGLDADLIMLALATHEVHFSILREDVLQAQQPVGESASETSLKFESGLEKIGGGLFNSSNVVKKSASLAKKPYGFLHVWILREYLELDIKITDPPENFKFDLERIVDDFVFICFFAGNDFLPHMPTLELHEGAIDLLIYVYMKEFKNFGGYLVDMSRPAEDKRAGYIKLSRVEKFILLVGSYEDKIFKKRLELRNRKLKRLCYYLDDQEDNECGNLEFHPRDNDHEEASSFIGSATVTVQNVSSFEVIKNTKELKEKLKSNLRKKFDLFKNGGLGTDKVRLGDSGWKDRYYKEKFSAESSGEIENLRKEIVKNYTEGLLWVLLYYFSGVPSWTWFYPYHYGPSASDLKGLAQVRVKFKKGYPFKPFDQLLSVLPPPSAHALPKVYHALMTNEESNIIDFYPTDFDVDTDGKRFMWQGICKLPFIEEGRLLDETKDLEKDLSEVEAMRNRNSADRLYVSSTCKLASQVLSLTPMQNESVKIDTSLSDGISGSIRHLNQDTERDQGEVHCNIEENCVLCVSFEMPDGNAHFPRLLDGVIIPEKTITEDDILETELWHEYQGNKPPSRPQQHQGCRKADNGTQEGYCRRFMPDSSTEVVHKQADHGWGAGRGKQNDSSNISKHIESTIGRIQLKDGERIVLPSSSFVEQNSTRSSWNAEKGYSHPVSSSSNLNNRSSNYNGTCALNQKWKPVGIDISKKEGFTDKDLKNSGSNEGFRPYGRTQLLNNNNFWQSRTDSTNDRNNAWHQKINAGATPSNDQQRGRQGSTDYTPNPNNMQVRGRGQNVTESSNRW